LEKVALKGHGFSRAVESYQENVWPLGSEGWGGAGKNIPPRLKAEAVFNLSIGTLRLSLRAGFEAVPFQSPLLPMVLHLRAIARRVDPHSSCITTMVAYHNPIPERKRRAKDSAGESASGGVGGGMMNAWVQAEKLMQIAIMLPCAGFIGWLAGYGLDRWLHQTWIGMAGAVCMATIYANDPGMNKLDENGNDAGNSGKDGDSDKAR
jgi:hypothetical protein